MVEKKVRKLSDWKIWGLGVLVCIAYSGFHAIKYHCLDKPPQETREVENARRDLVYPASQPTSRPYDGQTY